MTHQQQGDYSYTESFASIVFCIERYSVKPNKCCWKQQPQQQIIMEYSADTKQRIRHE